MDTTETLGSLAAALAAFQGEVPTVPKNKTASVQMKAGGQYSYKYADLADVAAAAYPVLSKHGLAFTCCPRRGPNGQELVATLMHSSGEQIEGALPISGNTPQELGSSISYARRYLLGAMTGVVTDADDDGALASAAPKQQRQSKPRQEPSARPADPKPETGELITDPQMRAMRATLAEVGLSDRDEILAEVAAIIGHPIASSKDLTRSEASKVIDRLKSLSVGATEGAVA